MAITPDLRPATFEDIVSSLTFALRFDGKKRVRHADDFMSRVAAEHLVKHLEASGFVITKRPPAAHHTSSRMPPLTQ